MREKRVLLKYNIILFFIISNAFSNEVDLLNLKKEKKALIDIYSQRIFEAEQVSLENRVALLDKTLQCFISSKSKRDITNCKNNERKRIMDLIR